MRRGLAIGIFAVLMGGVGAAPSGGPRTAGAQGCPRTYPLGSCCFCSRGAIKPRGLWNCEDGCPSCSGNACLISVIDPIRPIWGSW
jgi:hypothetical protein